jgi:hypothetical protein
MTSTPESRETAWRIHTAIGEWTARVDAKASFALTLESAALAGIVALSGEDHLFGNLKGYGARSLLWIGTLLILAGAVFAILVVVPRLRKSKVEPEAGQNYVYFGHLQFWDASALEQALQQEDVLPVLARQLVVTSRIAWQKHRFVQFSFLLSAIGGVFVFFAGIAA